MLLKTPVILVRLCDEGEAEMSRVENGGEGQDKNRNKAMKTQRLYALAKKVIMSCRQESDLLISEFEKVTS